MSKDFPLSIKSTVDSLQAEHKDRRERQREGENELFSVCHERDYSMRNGLYPGCSDIELTSFADILHCVFESFCCAELLRSIKGIKTYSQM